MSSHLFFAAADALDYLVKAISDLMFDSRENIDLGLINSWNEGNIVRPLFY